MGPGRELLSAPGLAAHGVGGGSCAGWRARSLPGRRLCGCSAANLLFRALVARGSERPVAGNGAKVVTVWL